MNSQPNKFYSMTSHRMTTDIWSISFSVSLGESWVLFATVQTNRTGEGRWYGFDFSLPSASESTTIRRSLQVLVSIEKFATDKFNWESKPSDFINALERAGFVYCVLDNRTSLYVPLEDLAESDVNLYTPIIRGAKRKNLEVLAASETEARRLIIAQLSDGLFSEWLETPGLPMSCTESQFLCTPDYRTPDEILSDNPFKVG